MISRIRSGKFWLKTLSIGAFVLIVLEVGARLALHQIVFSQERIHQSAEETLAGTGRRIRFNPDVGRTWFPRPTLTLHNIVISKSGSDAAEIHIREMKIGVAWKTLFGADTEIEKWVVKEAELDLRRRENGNWNLADLWQRTGKNRRVNRLIIENSKINFQTGNTLYPLQVNVFKLNRDGSSYLYETEGQTQLAGAQTDWQGSGEIQADAQGWRIPNWQLQANGQYQNRPFKLQSNGDVFWLRNDKKWRINTLQLNADIPDEKIHISANIPGAEWSENRLVANRINSVITADRQEAAWDSSLSINRLIWIPTLLDVGEITFEGTRKTDQSRDFLNLHTSLSWQREHGWQLPDVDLNARQELLNNNSSPRFASQLQGSFNYLPNGNWQGEFKGLFDQSPVAVSATYQRDTNRIDAQGQWQKINLTPYLQGVAPDTGISYPAFLQNPEAPSLALDFSVNTLQLPGPSIDNLQGSLQADRKNLVFRGSAHLYGGTSQGSFTVTNGQPLLYQIQQQATGINILPLLEDAFAYGSLTGSGDAAFSMSAQGRNRQEIISSLNGILQLRIQNGAWLGVDLNHVLSDKRQNIRYDRANRTPFDRFILNSRIINGVGSHQNAELRSERVHMLSSGSTDLNRRTLKENLIISNPQSKAPPIPLRIEGPIANPSITIDYPSLTRGLSTSEEKQKIISDTLKQQWNWLNR